MKKLFILTLLSICLSEISFSQGNSHGFIIPLKIPLLINGTFGELRGSHFHSGIDIKTEEREGLEVLAVADGFVSRIRVSAWGFGKALYVTHPHGYTTVYAHLSRYNPAIEKYIKEQQYKIRSYEIDINLSDEQIKVKQGDVIAFSGNSGSSAGPHLHFEVRDTKTEKALDPYLYGIKPEDNLAPVLKSLTIYALDSASYNGSEKKRHHVPLKNSGDKYIASLKEPLELAGKIGLGIEIVDHMPGLPNKLGVASITLKLNNQIIYHFNITGFYFGETRFINSHLDYEQRARNGKVIQKSFIDPGNKLSAYLEKSNGIIYPKPGEHLTFQYTVIDNAGNVSVCEFEANGVYTAKRSRDENISDCVAGIIFPFNEINKFSNNDVSVELPSGVLYDTLAFCYNISTNPGKYFSDIHFIHDKFTPVHSAYLLSLKPKELSFHLQSKAYLTYIDKGAESYEGGKFEKGFVSGKVRKLGAFAIAVDTIAPVIRPVNFKCNATIKGKELRIHISDKQSGVATYQGEINGEWVLFEHDGKSGIISHTFERPADGKQHKLFLKLADHMKNETVLECGFRR